MPESGWVALWEFHCLCRMTGCCLSWMCRYEIMIYYDYVRWFQFLRIIQNYGFVTFLSFFASVRIFCLCDHYFSIFFHLNLFSLNTLYNSTCIASIEVAIFDPILCSRNHANRRRGCKNAGFHILAQNESQSTPGRVTWMY